MVVSGVDLEPMGMVLVEKMKNPSRLLVGRRDQSFFGYRQVHV